MRKAIHANENIVGAAKLIEKLRGLHLPSAFELVEGAAEERLTYYAFPKARWQRIAPVSTGAVAGVVGK